MTKFKYLVVLLIFLSFSKVYALDDIKINNENLIPYFDKDTKTYNYYTNEEHIKISVSKSNGETLKGYGYFEIKDGLNEFVVESTKNDITNTYKINVYKNYNKDDENIATFKYLNIKGYDINFKNDIHDYYIDIEEAYLDFEYELDNYESVVKIENNGNFNDGNNDVIVNITSKNQMNENTYIFHVNKTKPVFKKIEEKTELTFFQKKIVVIAIVTFCSILTIYIYYLLFVKKIF